MKDLDYVNIRSVNPSHFVINEADEYIEEINGNKCFYWSKQRLINPHIHKIFLQLYSVN